AAVRAALRQPERDPVPAAEQLLVLMAAMEGLLDGLSESEVVAAMARMRKGVGDALDDVAESIKQNRPLEDDEKATLMRVARKVLELPEDNGHDPDA
ncbi:MAG: F0F1 ATP synthase subunit alpha, partial [Marinobacter sp.]|nr:F0F1 ATP synthase subunit alpha [Marinobacter sp.]